MGVPSFYRWISEKYPKIVVDVVEEKGENVDASLKNPNDLEFDNLYLDMNGIVHPCFHPEDSDSGPTTFDEVFENIYEYIDRIFNIIRPRKLLYMAIDGVAPRAKMNQQRTRRFRNARDRDISDKEEERLRREFELQGKNVLPKEKESEVSDSNIITPGTEFMQLLSMKLQSYIESRMCGNLAWKNIKVILSNANVPGEGEHKIMSFIRSQRCSPGYDPNTRHCLYGLDADLIMLALSTHEIHFSILREQVFFNGKNQNSLAYKLSLQEAGGSKQIGGQDSTILCKKVIEKKPYEFLHVWILREYLEHDLKITDPPKDFHEDLERLIDDFIFICFFAGNDFLPHMPTLEIHEGAINLMMHVYRKEFKNMGGYLVDMSRVDDRKGGFWKQSRVEKFILAVGSFEDEIFRKRSEMRDRMIRKILLDDAKARDEANEQMNVWNDDHDSVSGPSLFIANNSDVLENTKELKEKLKENLRKSADTFQHGITADKVKLGEDGFKKRFYTQKFSVDGLEEIECLRKKLVQKYTEGLCWVMLYYFSGVPSWKWFYPYHYGPFASDLKGLSQVKVKFEKGAPFKPFDQLMAVLPPRSAHALPGPLKKLMLDEFSPIIDFYSNDFEIDADGRRFVWMAICKLPFIEEERLVVETKKVQSDLKDHERKRNEVTNEMLFVESSTPLGGFLLPLCTNDTSAKLTDFVDIDSSLSRELNGAVLFYPEGCDSTEAYNSSDVICAFYKAPSQGLLIPRPLEGVDLPIKIVDEADISETSLWHESSKSNRSSTNRAQFSAKGPPHHGVASSDGSTGWGRGRGRCQGFSTQSDRINYSTARYGFHGRQENLVNPSPQVQRPIYRPQSNSRGSVPMVEYRGGGVGWGRGRGQPSSYRGESWKQNQFPVNTCTRHEGSAPIPWRPRDGNPGSAWGSNAMRVQRIAALRITTSGQDNDELPLNLRPHSRGARHSEAPPELCRLDISDKN